MPQQRPINWDVCEESGGRPGVKERSCVPRAKANADSKIEGSVTASSGQCANGHGEIFIMDQAVGLLSPPNIL